MAEGTTRPAARVFAAVGAAEIRTTSGGDELAFWIPGVRRVLAGTPVLSIGRFVLARVGNRSDSAGSSVTELTDWELPSVEAECADE